MMPVPSSIRRFSITLALALLVRPVAGQGVDGFEFIEWATTAGNAAVPEVDPERLAALRADERNYARRLVSTSLHFRENGDVEQWYRIIVEYVDTAGMDFQGNGSIYVNAFAERLQIEEARVVTPAGRVIDVDPETVQVLLEDTGGVFSDDYEVVVPWPSLEPGAVSALTYHLTTSREKLASPWSRIYFPQQLMPTGTFELNVVWDRDAVRPEVDTDFGALDCIELERSLRCTATGIDGIATDAQVNYFDELPYVAVSESTTWADIVELIGGYVAGARTDDEAIESVVGTLLAGADSDREKLQRLHSFVSRDVRYVGIETGVNGVIPRETGLTLSRRFGDCKDKTALFLHMATIAGLSADAVLVSSHRKNLEKIATASISYFDHMVACGQVDGRGFCVDLTDPHTPTESWPSYLGGALALPIMDGVDAPMSLPGPTLTWTLQVQGHNELDGSSIIERERRIFGPAYSGFMRSALVGLDQTDLTRWAVDRYESVISTVGDPTFTFVGTQDQQAPFIVSSENEYQNAIETDRPLNYYQNVGWLTDLANQFTAENEHYVYRFDGFAYRDTTSFGIEEWDVTSFGAEIEFESQYGHMHRSYAMDGDLLTVTTDVEVPRRVLEPGERDAFNRFLRSIRENSAIRFRADPRP